MIDFRTWLRKGETEAEHDQRVVTETGEQVRDACIRLAKRHNGWILAALRSDRKSATELRWREPKDWKRDVLDELEFMEKLGLVFSDDGEWWYAAD